jgi:hypothetical protein
VEAIHTFEKIISENNVSSARKYIKKLSTSYTKERLVLLSSFAYRKRNIALFVYISSDMKNKKSFEWANQWAKSKAFYDALLDESKKISSLQILNRFSEDIGVMHEKQ